MPYIVKERRIQVDPCEISPRDVGELNYAITQLVLQYLPPDPRYSDYNSVVGVLESAKLEFYRRAVAKYEDVKIKENGDVYPNV